MPAAFPEEQEMEADKRKLALEVQQQHQRLILRQAGSFGQLNNVEKL